MKLLLGLLCWALVLTGSVVAGTAQETERFPAPGPGHKCPVCGMFVYRYPDWVASVTYTDGSTVFFDGVKDMFKYLFNLQKYDPARDVKQIVSVRVTEYYDTNPIEGRTAFYVIGSDVLGPMGHELIPLRTEAEALEFKKDHQGRGVLTYPQVTPATISRLD
ncbi:MAG: nitrous oxide reductase accessory protein NosL [Desulfofustis sp.]|nr:nitrous oxide reductase accessory protein NosL [Desulfofustis sp.]